MNLGEAAAVAQEEEGQEGRQQQRRQPGRQGHHEVGQVALGEGLGEAGQLLADVAAQAGALEKGELRFQPVHGLLQQPAAALDVAAHGVLPAHGVRADPGEQQRGADQQQQDEAAAGDGRGGLAVEAVQHQPVGRRLQEIVDDQRQQEGHHQPEHLLEQEQQQAGRGDDADPDHRARLAIHSDWLPGGIDRLAQALSDMPCQLQGDFRGDDRMGFQQAQEVGTK
jgi:hypothetical protein